MLDKLAPVDDRVYQVYKSGVELRACYSVPLCYDIVDYFKGEIVVDVRKRDIRCSLLRYDRLGDDICDLKAVLNSNTIDAIDLFDDISNI